jgi:hypothetical protein
MIINKILVEAAGVELSSMLTARKLLILGTATTAKKAPLLDPLYVHCTKKERLTYFLTIGRTEELTMTVPQSAQLMHIVIVSFDGLHCRPWQERRFLLNVKPLDRRMLGCGEDGFAVQVPSPEFGGSRPVINVE